jgi:branched-subunit amino acid transport protein
MPARLAASVSRVWLAVVVVGAATIALKAAGPVLLGGRPLPPRIRAVVRLLAPALLAALVVIQTFGSGRHVVVDARIAGVAVAAVALRLRAPILVAVVLAAALTAGLRAL